MSNNNFESNALDHVYEIKDTLVVQNIDYSLTCINKISLIKIELFCNIFKSIMTL